MATRTANVSSGGLWALLQGWWSRPDIRYPVCIFVAARVLSLAVGVSSTLLGPAQNPYANTPIFRESLETTQHVSPFYDLIEPWHRWDTGWYLKIAGEGYDNGDGSIVFAPLYPTLIAILTLLTRDALLSALLISSAACLAFLLLFYRLALRETGTDRRAVYALLAAASFPTAFFLLAGYTESVFLACVAGAFVAAFASNWWLAGLLALAASLTRVQGWVLFFPIGWLALVQAPGLWLLPLRGSWLAYVRRAVPRLAATGAGPLGAALVFAYFSLAKLGSVDQAYFDPWGMYIRPPWSAVLDVIVRVVMGTASLTEYLNLVALALVVGLMILSIYRLPAVYHWYMWPTLVLILLRYYPLYLLNGTMRYVLDFFPIFITLGVMLAARPRLRVVWLGAATVIQIVMLFVFMRWVWVS